MARSIGLDSNLLILLVVGSTDLGYVAAHKRLTAFDAADYGLLLDYIGGSQIVTTPNVLTETSNLLAYGVSEPRRGLLLANLSAITNELDERLIRSRAAMTEREFPRLGLTDAAWLHLLDKDIELVTVDLGLFIAAQSRGLRATNFNRLRDL